MEMIKIRGILEEGDSQPPPSSEKNDEEPKLNNYSDALNVALKVLEDLGSEADNK